MSGISEERLHSLECACDFQRDLPWVTKSLTERDFMVAAISDMPRLIAEIRRLRAENAEVRASYERVEKYAQDLLQEREILAAMVPSK